MTTTHEARPIYTSVLPLPLVALDIEVRRDFLSDDLETVCAIAGKTGSALLISTAGAPLEQREASFAIWRKQGLAKLAGACPDIGPFLQNHVEAQQDFESGTIDLLALDAAIANDREEKQQLALARLKEKKEAVREGFRSNFGGDFIGFPKVLVVRSDGSMKLFKNQGDGKLWGKEDPAGFQIGHLEIESFRIFLHED